MEPISLGTSIMAVQFDGGVVLGADSQTSMGTYVSNRVSNKLTPLYEPYIYCCRSGSAADTQALSEIIQVYAEQIGLEDGKSPSVFSVATMLKNLCYDNKDQLLAGMIVAGWDKHNGGSVYNIPLGGSIHKQPFAIGGSGSAYIYGYCDSAFVPDMDRGACERFVVNSLALAMERDGSSGGVIRTITIDSAGACRNLYTGKDIPVFWNAH